MKPAMNMTRATILASVTVLGLLSSNTAKADDGWAFAINSAAIGGAAAVGRVAMAGRGAVAGRGRAETGMTEGAVGGLPML